MPNEAKVICAISEEFSHSNQSCTGPPENEEPAQGPLIVPYQNGAGTQFGLIQRIPPKGSVSQNE